jgi:antitoxin PrlF
VTISRVEDTNNNPLLGQFLDFLATDIQQNPHHVRQVNSDLVDRIRSLVGDVDLDLDAPLVTEDGERFFSGEGKDPKCGKMALCLNLSK